MTLMIRDTGLGDLPAITDIYADSVENGTATYELTPPSLEEMTSRFQTMTEANYPYLVAEEDGIILGYAYAGPFRARPAYRWSVEDSIYLAPNARGRGVGFSLLTELVKQSEERGFRQMLAVIGGAEPGSIAVHKKAGFEDGGIMRATGYKHGKWLDTVIMQLPLNGGAQTHPDMDQFPGNMI